MLSVFKLFPHLSVLRGNVQALISNLEAKFGTPVKYAQDVFVCCFWWFEFWFWFWFWFWFCF